MVARPPLPVRFANPRIKEHCAQQLPPVKYQILNCQGKDILVGRLKIETPTESGHAFILRRFDTGAVSLTTMFRAAFPKASDAEEKQEIQWVKDSYDLTGNNGSTKDTHITRLAGTWVSPQVALELGKAYALGNIIHAVVDATPDPSGNYRRSGKGAAAGGTPNAATTATTTAPVSTTTTAMESVVVISKPPSASKSLPTPSPTSADPPAKRRKESSPAPSQSRSSSKPPSRASPTPQKVAVATRRSTRTKSPAPRSVAGFTSIRTPNKRGIKKDFSSVSVTPGGSELTAVDEEGQMVEDGVAGTELMDEDIKEQQQLIQGLKEKRDAAKVAQEETDMDLGEEATSSTTTKKREREEEEEQLKFEFKEPETEERAVVTNRRVGRFNLEPRTKSFAWGVAAFAVGMGAVTFLPSFF